MRALHRHAVCSGVLRIVSIDPQCPVSLSFIREQTVSGLRSTTSHCTVMVAFDPFESALESASWLLVSGKASGKGSGNRAGRAWAREGRQRTGMDTIEGDVGGERPTKFGGEGRSELALLLASSLAIPALRRTS
jgi:hypothetical protein